jgi:hypothetical protein
MKIVSLELLLQDDKYQTALQVFNFKITVFITTPARTLKFA